MKKEEKKELEAKEELKEDKKNKKAKKEKKGKKNAKDLTPEEAAAKDARKVLAVKCVSAILCAVIFSLSVSSAFGKLAEAVKAEAAATPASSNSASDSSSDVDDFFGDDAATDATVTDGDTATDDTATDGDTATDATVADDSASATDSTAADNNAAAKDDTASKKPSTPAEVIAYFNTAANKVKTDAKTVEQKSVKNYLDQPATISSGIKSVYNMLGGDDWLNDMLVKNSQGAATFSTKADIQAHFPVEGETWSSKLTANDVKGATCTEANGVYTIKIMTKADAKSDSIKHGQGYNPKAFNVILPGVVNDNIPGIAASLVGTASMNYPSSTIVATVDAATGNITTITYDLKWTINFDKMGIILPFATTSIYNIKW